MKKRGRILLLLVLMSLLLPEVFSIYEELAYSGTVDDRDTVNITGAEFYFRIDRSGIASVDVDTSGIIIKNSECGIKGKFHICIKNISFSYRNYDPWYDVYKALVEVYQIKSNLELTQTIQKNNLLVDEETFGELAFENTADITAKDVVGTLKIPDNLLVLEADGCKHTSDAILFDYDVPARYTKKCTYKLMGLIPGDFELKANISYFDGTAQVTANSNTVSGKVYNDSLSIEYQLDKYRINISENLNISVVIKNTNDEYDLYLTTFSINIPEKILVVEKPKELNPNGNVFSWSGQLKANEEKNFSIGIEGSNAGNHTILAKSSYKESKFLRQTEKPLRLEVHCDCPYLSHEISEYGQENLFLKAFIFNPGINNFKNLKITYKSDISGIEPFSSASSSLNQKDLINIFEGTVKKSDTGFYHFNITAAYESYSGEVFYIKDNIIVKPYSNEEEIQDAENITDSLEESAIAEETKQSQPEETKEPDAKEENPESEQVPVTTINSEAITIKSYLIIAFISALTLISVLVVIFRRKHHVKENTSEIKETVLKDANQIEKEIMDIGKGLK